jgi:hypothetical protein
MKSLNGRLPDKDNGTCMFLYGVMVEDNTICTGHFFNVKNSNIFFETLYQLLRENKELIPAFFQLSLSAALSLPEQDQEFLLSKFTEMVQQEQDDSR